MLCGTEPAAPGPGLALLGLRLEPEVRCVGPDRCSPCLQARLRLGLEPEEGGGDAGTAASPRRDVTALLLLSGHGYASSRCVAVEVRASSAMPGRRLVRLRRAWMWGRGGAGARVGAVARGMWARRCGFPAQGSVRFCCFEAPLGSELHVTAYSGARGRRRLSQTQRLPGEPRPRCTAPLHGPAPSSPADPVCHPYRLLVARCPGCHPAVPR